MRVILTHKIALNPTKQQLALLVCAVGVARFAYNWALRQWQDQYKAGEKPSEGALRRQINAIKREAFPWMYDVPKSVVQQAIKNLGRAFTNFFAKRTKYPCFKRKGVHDSARFDDGPGTFAFNGKRIKLPIIGWIKMREELRFHGKPLSVTVSRVADRWFVSIPVEVEIAPAVRENQATVGVVYFRLSELSCTVPLAIFPSRSSVLHICAVISNADVSGLIIPVVINPVNLFPFRNGSDVRPKNIEVFSPRSTNTNAASAIIWIRGVTGIRTTLNYPFPYLIFSAVRPSQVIRRADYFAEQVKRFCPFPGRTSTTNGVAINQACSKYFDTCAAIALAQPLSVFAAIGRDMAINAANSGQFSKLLIFYSESHGGDCTTGGWFWQDPGSRSVGVDFGLNRFAALSNGEVVEAPKPLKKLLGGLRRLSRSLARKKRGSSNQKKVRQRLARLHRRIANIRQDFLHKFTTGLVRRFAAIGIEDLNVRGMLRNHRLARAIADVSWGEARRQLKYKSPLYDSEIVVHDRWFPSSKTCSICGFVNKAVVLGVESWTCPVCGTVHDRDENAAENLKPTAASCAVEACGDGSAGQQHKLLAKLPPVKQEPACII